MKNGNNSWKQHGTIDVLLELTPIEIPIENFKNVIFWASKMLSSKCHLNYNFKNFEKN